MSFNLPERVENFSITAEFQVSKLTDNERILVEKRFLQVGSFVEGETVKVTYDCKFEIFNIVSMFETFIMLFDKASLIKIETRELGYGRSLIQELLIKLEQLEGKFKAKGL